MQYAHRILVVLLSLVFIVSCKSALLTPDASTQASSLHVQETTLRDTHEMLDGTLWVQTSAEYQILCKVAYAQAQQNIISALEDGKWTAAIEQSLQDVESLPPALIVDVDETVLDNSRFQGQMIVSRSVYSPTLWKDWVNKGMALPVPGAKEFLKFAESKKVVIFYITNRDAKLEQETINNLNSAGFPNANQDTVLSKGDISQGSDKKSRREAIARDYRVILIVGDDLGDFISGHKDTPEKRVELANKYIEYWGRRWMLLPNPLYGSWETALYADVKCDDDEKGCDEKQLKAKIKHVKGFE